MQRADGAWGHAVPHAWRYQSSPAGDGTLKLSSWLEHTRGRAGTGQTDRRTPLALVDVSLGPVTVTLAVARLRRGGLDVRPPKAADGGRGFCVPSDLQARLVALAVEAVKADPEAGPLLTLAPWQRPYRGATP